MHFHSFQHQLAPKCAGKHVPVHPALSAAGGQLSRSSSWQQNAHAKKPRSGIPSPEQWAPAAGDLLPDAAQQPANQSASGQSWQQQAWASSSSTTQQQQPASELYIAEPWEVPEPWDDPGTWQQQQQQPPAVPGATSQQPQQVQQQQQQRRQQDAARSGANAGGTVAAADELLDSLDWLLEGEEGEEGDDDDESMDGSDREQDGWWADTAEAVSSNWQQPPLTSIQQQQQQWLPGNQPDQWGTQVSPQQKQQHKASPQGHQQQPPAAAEVDLQSSWDAALAASTEVLASYDVRYDVTRAARISSSAAMCRTPGSRQQQQAAVGLGPDEVSLTAAALAAARAGRRKTRHKAPATPLVIADQQQQQQQASLAAVGASSAQQQQQQQHPGSEQTLQDALPLPEDARWLAVSRAHAAYLSYMKQLAGMVVSKQQQQHQLVYQVGISDAWLQLSHLLDVFGGQQLTPPVVAAMWKRLAAIINRKVFVRMSHAERCHYDAFIERLVAQSITTLQHYSSGGSSSSSTSTSSSSTSSSRRTAAADETVISPVLPAHLAVTAYGMAVLGASSNPLAAAVVDAAADLLAAAATAADSAAADTAGSSTAAAAAAGSLSSSSSSSASSIGASTAAAAAAANAGSRLLGGWGPGDVSSLMWGLGVVGYSPPPQWLADMQAVSRELLPRCQPAQLWGVLWGFAQCGSPPDEPWLASWLSAAQQQLDGFNAEGLAHSIWALAAVGHVPHKLWLRAFCGMVAFKIKSFQAGHLSMVLPALSTLGYKPRPELGRTIMAQVRRHLHTYSPSQLVSVLSAVASYPPGEGEPASSSGWHPGRLLLYDFITHSSRTEVMAAWSGRQAAQVLWVFSRFRYVPDRAYLVSLQSHLQAQLPLCGPDALSMALWALAALRQPLPSHTWAQQWCEAALGVAGEWGPQALAHGLAGMAALRVQPPAALMQALTRRASSCLSSFSCMELGLLIAALADLHWRPSDAWMAAFVSQMSQQLPAFENEDYGLLLYGLASLAQPLQPVLLARFCHEAALKLYGLSGEGLGLLVWGLAQYDYDMPDAEQWWQDVYDECSNKWGSAGLRGCALMALGVAQLGPRYPPPGVWERDWVRRYKALVPTKPRSWQELVVGFRAAAGLEPAEVLPSCPWLCSLLLQLARSWGIDEPDRQQGLAGVAAVIEAVNVRIAATAALANTVDVGYVGAAAEQEVQSELQGGGQLGSGDCEPTSATAVLL